MPTYEYICAKCGHHFDLFQSIKEDAITVCPKGRCAREPWGRGQVKRAISSGAGLIFKGSGFYITDYRSESYKEAAKKEAAQAKPDSAKSASSQAGETKPAAPKPESKPKPKTGE